MFRAKFLNPVSTTPRSKLFERRAESMTFGSSTKDNLIVPAAARRASAPPEEEKVSTPVIVVSPEMFATMVPAIADLTTADAEPVTEVPDASSTPATKVKKSGRKRKKESSGDTARKKSS